MDYKHLYKFRVMDTNSLACLANCHLWFSKLEDLNDPFEGVYDVDTLVENMKSKDLYDLVHKIQHMLKPKENVEQRTESLLKVFLEKGQSTFEFGAKQLVKEVAHKKWLK